MKQNLTLKLGSSEDCRKFFANRPVGEKFDIGLNVQIEKVDGDLITLTVLKVELPDPLHSHEEDEEREEDTVVTVGGERKASVVKSAGSTDLTLAPELG